MKRCLWRWLTMRWLNKQTSHRTFRGRWTLTQPAYLIAWCGQRGHYKRNCPEIKWFYCGKTGHVKKCYSFYSSYLQTKSSSSYLTNDSSQNTKKINNFIINKRLNEEERVPQKMDHLLDKKDFEDYKGKISQSLKRVLKLHLLTLRRSLTLKRCRWKTSLLRWKSTKCSKSN
jgi:hypothetical protein